MRKRLPIVILVAVVVVVILAISGIGVSLALENQDSFCASCHTEPEVTYWTQSTQANAPTLAAFHTGKKTACIDCHSGGGIFGRAKGLQQGAVDQLAYWGGHYQVPAVTTNPLGDDSCTKCHAVTNLVVQRGTPRQTNGHYHQFLPRWQAADPNAAHCITCHSAHQPSNAQTKFINQAQVNQVCNACHRALGGGD